MIITIKCPACNAQNKLTREKQSCRRCSIDLNQLYTIKAYSFGYRLQLLQILKDTNHPDRVPLARLATRLKK